MIAGVPGVGITGVFYLLLAALMPIRECWFTVTGRSSLARWITVIVQVSIAAGVLLTLGAEYWLVKRGFDLLHRHVTADTVLDRIAVTGTAAVAPCVTIAPFIALGMIILTVQALRLLLPARPDPTPDPLPPPVEFPQSPDDSGPALLVPAGMAATTRP